MQRSLALAILTVSNIVGTAFGFLLPSFFVDATVSDVKVQDQFTALLFLEFFMSLIPLTMVLLWFRESPPTPVSPCSDVKRTKYS